ncbi:MAG: YggS family pyridoxal phosphate-dependent enzyme [Dethiobacter sp.]|jgi:pyridoxal phosphate enzyme (YggS family)|nr:YggS family pyridoxal phosphate-dependent enzyme [Dethiobacter sp.]MBS3900273.1 YggS family pyridoxal phosphate-dependent enzyme [Dethiobacter sp.]MBS3983510.1 YggS family pyridoxal phosphate-dependent enzyme [Dethiobacter sp.]MCL4463403.1 YggS family pyridoxal phosphate-dependent enzyme [Bacillota bacterium]MCL5992870.1 YggS family pyridoxal phosphate-dependent enzyme [Bacillota bacterium]
MSSLAARLAEFRIRLSRATQRSGRGNVGMVAVTKTVPTAIIAEAIALGLTVFGENRVQEAWPKIEALPTVEWHFIGRLQTNKVKDVVGRFQLIHSLDRWRLAEALQREAQAQNLRVSVLIQVNLGGEEQKGGISPAELQDFLSATVDLPQLQVEGLMAIPPYMTDPEEARPYFREMFRLFSDCRLPGRGMKILSMGMSNDFEVAIEEGANLIRVGSLLFGREKYSQGE